MVGGGVRQTGRSCAVGSTLLPGKFPFLSRFVPFKEGAVARIKERSPRSLPPLPQGDKRCHAGLDPACKKIWMTDFHSYTLKMKAALASKCWHAATPPQTRDRNVDAHSTQVLGGTGSNHIKTQPGQKFFDYCQTGRESLQSTTI
ncbi:hypothetical protein AAG570_001356 [Ranatra chinensis]|uniref:Uncharacterized protein n=1 Tax=Ranatra chinensis TaxID=642074 RepID=A0ABD0YY20_9HEMI